MRSRKAFRFLAVAVLFVIAATVAAFADPVEARFAGLGGENQNEQYTYPYYITLNNGAQIPMMCDDYEHQSNVGDTWQANVTSLVGGHMGDTRFNSLNKYKEAAFLLMQVNDSDQSEWGNINFAVWKIFDSSVNIGNKPTGTMGPQYWYDLARTTNLSNIDFSEVRILTPLQSRGESGDQEFLFLAPEPGTLMLIGSGLIGLFSQRKRLA